MTVRYQRGGDPGDLDEAAEVTRNALDAMPMDDPDRPWVTTTLAVAVRAAPTIPRWTRLAAACWPGPPTPTRTADPWAEVVTRSARTTRPAPRSTPPNTTSACGARRRLVANDPDEWHRSVAHSPDSRLVAAYAPDGRRLAIATDDRVTLCDAATGTGTALPGVARAVAFTPDGYWAIHPDGSAHLHDETGATVRDLAAP